MRRSQHRSFYSIRLAARMKKIARLVPVFLLAACGNNPHPAALHTQRADGSPWVVFYRAVPEDPRTLDPQVCYDTLSNLFVSTLYESMLQYAPFQTEPYALEPCLAESMPERTKNADGTESYLFKIKRGLRFHDDPCFTNGVGREVVAQDILYALHRIADPKVECPVLSTLGNYLPGLNEAYENARKTGKFDYAQPLACCELIDDHTFRLHLSRAYPQILYWFAMPFTAPVPREAVDFYDGAWHDGVTRDQFKFHAVGTGAFQQAEWSRGRLIRLVRDDHYRATAFPENGWKLGDETHFRPLAGHALPFVDEVQFAIIHESIPGWLLFRQGYEDRSGIGKDVFHSVLNNVQQLTPEYRARGIQLYKDAEPTTSYAVFNMEDPVLGKNKPLRQAISSAYDEQLANQIFFNGVDLDAQQLLPPGVIGHQSNFENPYRQHDLPLARRLMKDAGYPDGVDARTGQQLELSVDLTAESAEGRQMAEFEKNQIEQLGIRVNLNENTWARLLDKMEHGQFQIYAGSGWNADYPDPENFFALFYSKNFPPQGSNSGRYNNPVYDRIFEQMSTMDNGPGRLQLIAQLNSILVEDCPFVLNAHSVVFSLAQPWTPRVTENAMLNNGMKYVQLDPRMRVAKQRQWNEVNYFPAWLTLGVVAVGAGSALAWNRKRNV